MVKTDEMKVIKNALLFAAITFLIVYVCEALAIGLLYINGNTISSRAFMETTSMITQVITAVLIVFGGGGLLISKFFCKW